MIDSNLGHDFDDFQDDFVVYLAERLGVSKEAALCYLGDWLSTFSAEALRPLLDAEVEPDLEPEIADDTSG